MKGGRVALALLAVLAGISGPATAADLKDKVKVEILTVGLHPGMDPGMYVCAAGHLHIKGTVQNLGGVPLGKVKLAGKAFGPTDNLLGTATTATKAPEVQPGEKVQFDLEFLTVGGPLIPGVKRHEISVVEAPPLKP